MRVFDLIRRGNVRQLLLLPIAIGLALVGCTADREDEQPASAIADGTQHGGATGMYAEETARTYTMDTSQPSKTRQGNDLSVAVDELSIGAQEDRREQTSDRSQGLAATADGTRPARVMGMHAEETAKTYTMDTSRPSKTRQGNDLRGPTDEPHIGDQEDRREEASAMPSEGSSCEYRQLGVASDSPSWVREGWKRLMFFIEIRNTSKGIVPILPLHPTIEAVAGANESVGDYVYVPPEAGDRKVPRGRFLPPGYFIVTGHHILVPARAPGLRLSLLTPDERRVALSLEGPFSPKPSFPAKTKDELALGDSFTVEGAWKVTPLPPDPHAIRRSRIGMLSSMSDHKVINLPVRLKNLSLHDADPDSLLYFQILDGLGYSDSAGAGGSVPPLYEKTRNLCFRMWYASAPPLQYAQEDIPKENKYMLLVGVRSKPNADSLVAYKVYRFETGPPEPDSAKAPPAGRRNDSVAPPENEEDTETEKAPTGTLSGTWRNPGGAEFRIVDDGKTITIDLIASDLLKTLNGTLTGRDATLDRKTFDGTLRTVFRADPRKTWTIRVSAIPDDARTLRLRCSDWPVFDRRGKHVGTRLMTETLTKE